MRFYCLVYIYMNKIEKAMPISQWNVSCTKYGQTVISQRGMTNPELMFDRERR
jgi:hypothetical protein